MAGRLHVVHKRRYNEQHFYPAPNLGPLAASSIRIRTVLVGLSSNNLSYCLMGDALHWWDCFPTPSHIPNAAEFGVPPAWGYALVEESNIATIAVGRLVYGMIPLSAHAVDLQLRPVESMPSHFIETSEHRAKVMAMYQRYQLELPNVDLSSQLALWNAAIKTSESGILLARECFAQDDRAPVHPFGVAISTWTEQEANLDGACIVCLAAGTKTSRCFLYELARTARTKRPNYSVLEVTSGPDGCERFVRDVPFAHKVVNYRDIAESFTPHEKYVLIDFGGRDFALEKAARAAKVSNPSAKIICISVGAEAKVYGEQDMAKRRQMAADLQTVQMNATSIRDVVMARDGEAQYFQELDTSFSQMVNEQTKHYKGKVLGIDMNIYHGLEGSDGVAGLWQRLCAGQIDGNKGIVVRLD